MVLFTVGLHNFYQKYTACATCGGEYAYFR